MNERAKTVPPSALTREVAVRTINALRQGSNLLEDVSHFSAGREPIYHAAETLMDELTFSSGSAVRWLKGQYGSGKTHTFARLLEAAHSKRWIVSYLQVSSKGQGCELHRFEEVYAAIIRNCVSPELRRTASAGDGAAGNNGWEWLLNEWVEALRRQCGAPAGSDLPTFRFKETVETTVSQLRLKFGIYGAFGAALKAYAIARVELDMDRTDLLLQWFDGRDVFKLGADVRIVLRKEGILETVSRKNAKPMLRQVTAFMRYRGYEGALILVDEVENVLQLTPRNRRTAYTILRELIDNVDERHGMARTLVYLSGTPDLFEGEKGIVEYEALASRVLLPSGKNAPNPAASVVDLEAFPITRDNLLSIGAKIVLLYSVAAQSRRKQELLRHLDVSTLMSSGALPSPRLWVRRVVDFLDRETQ